MSTNTGKRRSNCFWMTSICRAMRPALRSISAGSSRMRLSAGRVKKIPFTGQFGRFFLSIPRNSRHSPVVPGSTSSNISRPAVSRMTAWLVNHQFMLMVPPTPWSSSCIPGGKPTPEWRMASVLPAPGSPMIIYQGSW